MKYILAFYLCLLISGGHKYNQYPQRNATIAYVNGIKGWWLQKTKKEALRDDVTVKQFSQSVCNSLRFIKIGLWD